MKIIVAPDSFKGSISALRAADQIEEGIRTVFPSAHIVKIPMADGGEGTAETIRMITGGDIIEHEVRDPCNRPIRAGYCWIDSDRTAVIDTAAASGLPLLEEHERKPEELSTYGTGQLIRHALDRGAAKIILGLGGSATIDAGTGCLRALGMRYLDRSGNEISGGGSLLGKVERIDADQLDPRLEKVEMVIASDVRNPLLGSEGAVHVFGPQKGLQKHELADFDNKMSHYADIAEAANGRSSRDSPGAGAAGGFGFTLMSFFPGGKMMSGFELIAELSGLERQLQDADLVITGEGKFDAQSLYGKVPVGISRLAKPYGVPTVVFAGQADGDMRDANREGIHLVVPIVDQVMTLDEAMKQGETLLKGTVVRMFQMIRLAGLINAKGVSN
ncbi:glycerate kinase [Paenibacillus apiarius]|uniref:glycerate kinase family protein n=1 Tax=Paenibacillus apiarius TaxID=46240 RepID=UPI003B3A305A